MDAIVMMIMKIINLTSVILMAPASQRKSLMMIFIDVTKKMRMTMMTKTTTNENYKT